MQLKKYFSFDNASELLNACWRPLNLKVFLLLRVITFLGMLLAEGLFFVMGAPAGELMFFFFLIVFWFGASFLLDLFFVAAGRVLMLRCALFAMVDVYLMLSLFTYAGKALTPAIWPLAGYIILASASSGLLAGMLAVATGFVAFLQGYHQIDIGISKLLMVTGIALASLLCGMIVRFVLPHLAQEQSDALKAERDNTRKPADKPSSQTKKIGAEDTQEKKAVPARKPDEAATKIEKLSTSDGKEGTGEKETTASTAETAETVPTEKLKEPVPAEETPPKANKAAEAPPTEPKEETEEKKQQK